MVNKLIVFFIFTLILINHNFSLKVKKQKPGKEKAFKKYHFKIREFKNTVYKLKKTSNEKIVSHFWKMKEEKSFLDIRCAKDFIHLTWKHLLRIYKENSKDLFKELKLQPGKTLNVKNKWLWRTKGKCVLQTGSELNLFLIIIKNRNFVYYISLCFPVGQTPSGVLTKMVNSIIFL